MKITVLGSGSGGNAAVIQNNGRAILIDAGFTCKNLQTRMTYCGINPVSVSAVFITHEHTDHVKGLGVFARKHRIPVYLSEGTFNSMYHGQKLEIDKWVSIIKTGVEVDTCDMRVTNFPVPHDAGEPVGYTFSDKNNKISYVTDIGSITNTVRDNLKNSRLIVLESNHDEKMLRNGPYPAFLKQRVSGPNGHLSNDETGKLLNNVMWDGLKAVYLAHLSKENNRPQLALNTVCESLNGHYDAKPEFILTYQEKPAEPYQL